MTPLPRWRLGEPLTVSLEDLATGRSDVTTRAIGRIAWSRTRRVAMFEPAAEDTLRALPLSPHSFDLSPGLKPGDPGEFDGLHGVFSDSLPDGWGRLLVDREAEARGLRRSDLTPIDRLAIIGTAGMGALAYRPEADRHPEHGWKDLAEFADAAERVLAEADHPAIADAIDLRAALGGSGGARPKIVCQIEEVAGDEAALRPAGAPPDPAFGHWMVKFPSHEDGPGAAEIEYAYSLMARAAGIDMPDTRLVTARDGRRFFAIRRFDRQVTPEGKLRRWHMLTVSGALESEHRKFAFDYETLLTWIWQLTRDERAVAEGFRRAAFNAMAHNRDDHGRQHSALLDLDGQGKWRWHVSPAYDLTPSHGPGGEHSLAIAGAGKEIGRQRLQALAGKTPLRKERAEEILDQVAEAVSHWSGFAGEAGLSRAGRERVAAMHRIA